MIKDQIQDLNLRDSYYNGNNVNGVNNQNFFNNKKNSLINENANTKSFLTQNNLIKTSSGLSTTFTSLGNLKSDR